MEVRDHSPAVPFLALQNIQSKKRACDFYLNTEYIPGDEDLENNKHEPYVVIVPLFISANSSFYTIDDLPKVCWDTSNGAKLYTFVGHNAPVCSFCSHKNNTYYVFSISSDVQIEAWLCKSSCPSSTSCTLNALVYSADGFKKVDENHISSKMFFEVRKHKYLEALDKGENVKALDVQKKQLKTFLSFDKALDKDLATLLTTKNFRENEHLSAYGDAQSARAALLTELKRLIGENPLICNNLRFPNLKTSRLRALFNQSGKKRWRARLLSSKQNQL